MNLSMSIEDAFKIVVSGGIVAPSSLTALFIPQERQPKVRHDEISNN